MSYSRYCKRVVLGIVLLSLAVSCSDSFEDSEEQLRLHSAVWAREFKKQLESKESRTGDILSTVVPNSDVAESIGLALLRQKYDDLGVKGRAVAYAHELDGRWYILSVFFDLEAQNVLAGAYRIVIDKNTGEILHLSHE